MNDHDRDYSSPITREERALFWALLGVVAALLAMTAIWPKG